jgi:pyrroline-5-carboxylate reductase
MPEIFAFMGAGNMAEAFCTGMVQKGGFQPSNLRASDIRLAAEIAWPARLGVSLRSTAADAARDASTLVVAVKPKDVPALLQSLLRDLGPDALGEKRIISIAAGMATGKIESMVAPAACPVIRVMPNTPAMVGMGASAYCLGTRAGEADAQVAEAMLKSLGLAVRVKESAMNAVTALSGSGPAYVFLMAEAMAAGGEALGLDPETAFSLACQTLLGSGEMLRRRQDTPARLREKVTSPGGTTAAALKVFEERGFRSMVAEAMKAAALRSAELGK